MAMYQYHYSMEYKVLFCGLPSSGKSTIINSLIGERILQSGVCRTTTNVREIQNISDDDNNVFTCMDLPGICDSEENQTNFNQMTHENIKQANLICFVSDVNKAFITTHEVAEYNRIKDIAKSLQEEHGEIHDVVIILSKCDASNTTQRASVSKQKGREIEDSDEDTNVGDLIAKVREKMQDDDIILFNAFGRIMHSNRISDNLKRLVKKNGVSATTNNMNFSINKYCANIEERQKKMYLNKFSNLVVDFLNSKISIDRVMVADDNLTDEDRETFITDLMKNSVGKWTYKTYQLIDIMIGKHVDLYNNNKHLFSVFLCNVYCNIINKNEYAMRQNLVSDCGNTIWDKMHYAFRNIRDTSRKTIVQEMLFANKYLINTAAVATFLTEFWHDVNFFEEYGIYGAFNAFIMACNKEQFNRFYNIVMMMKPLIVQMPSNAYLRDEINRGPRISEMINRYLAELDGIITPEFIMYNKVEILKQIMDCSTTQTCLFKQMTARDDLLARKIKNTRKYKQLEYKFYGELGNAEGKDPVYLTFDELMY